MAGVQTGVGRGRWETGRIGNHGGQPSRRSAGPTRRPCRSAPPGDGLLLDSARSRRRRPAGGIRHVGPPRVGAQWGVQRGAHPGDHPGHRRVPRRPRHYRPVVHRPGHARPLRAGLGLRAGGAGRQRRSSGGGQPRPVYADPGDQPRHPHLQPRSHRRAGRRDRRDAVAQPALGRGLQIQPAQRRPSRHRRHQRNRQARQRDSARRLGRQAHPAGPRAADRAAPRLPR